MQQESYVVRVYRRARDDPREIVGTVEAPANGREAAFHSLAELCLILEAPRRRLKRARVSPANRSKSQA